MSRVLKQIEVSSTGKRFPNFEPLNYVDAKKRIYDYKHYSYCTEYRVIATLGANLITNQQELESVGWQYLIKSKIYRPLAEEIFGEYRMPLLEADRAAYEGDYRKVSEIIHNVLDSMFKV